MAAFFMIGAPSAIIVRGALRSLHMGLGLDLTPAHSAHMFF
jgi:hypothetical protein